MEKENQIKHSYGTRLLKSFAHHIVVQYLWSSSYSSQGKLVDPAEGIWKGIVTGPHHQWVID